MNYDYATHYSYDIHGNVKTLWQENPKFEGDLALQRFKRIDYDYDLVSGKVNEVKYQANQPDQFIHRYEYDADNRIIHVQTSKDGVFFDNDASYSYYLHGPLARVEVGNENVQGIDYAYTLQGWIKGVNSNSLNENLDMGIDGKNITGNSNKNFARDAFGYSLNYFDGDYTPIDLNKQQTANNFIANTNNLTNLVATNLYNGNIKSMVTTIRNLNTSNGNVIPQITGYNYDQLNRIKGMQAFVGLDTVNNIWVQSGNEYNHRYQNDFTYDANGNISTLQRYNQAGVLFDDFNYKYQELNLHKISNRLYHVNDVANANLMPDDIDDQGDLNANTNYNYGYDEIGNLKYDKAEGIESIEWTAYGKIKSITRINGFSKTVNGQTIYPSNLEFKYDATGNRIAKIEKPNDANGNTLQDENRWITTYYVRDATGNPMATYKLSQVPLSNPGLTSYKLIERPIYGSSRVGIDNTELELVGYTAPTDGITTHILGLKQYELVNHLGNVLTTITDKKIPVESNGAIDHYVADITSATDYYPFGSPMDGRNFSSDKYRFGFNGKENDNEVKGEGSQQDYGMRIYDSRLGRFLSTDPIIVYEHKYPELSTYQFASNTPVWAIDLDGLEAKFSSNGQFLEWGKIKGDNAPVIIVTSFIDSQGKVKTTEEKLKSGVSSYLTYLEFLQTAAFAYNETRPNNIVEKYQIANIIVHRHEVDKNKDGEQESFQHTLDNIACVNDSQEERMLNNRKIRHINSAEYAKMINTYQNGLKPTLAMQKSISAAINAFSKNGTDYAVSETGVKALSWIGNGINGTFYSTFKHLTSSIIKSFNTTFYNYRPITNKNHISPPK